MPALREWVDPAGVPVRILTRRSRGRWKDLFFAIGVAWALWRDRKRYDVVYFLMQGLHLAAGLPVARALGKPIVMKISGSGIIPIMVNSRLGRLELKWLAKWASRVMLLNEGMFDEAMAGGLPREKLFWMPNPVDTDEFQPAQPDEIAPWRERHGIPPQSTVAIYVGRLSHEKGLTQLLRGFAKAACAVPAAMLILVGDGPQRGELEALAKELGLGRSQVRFVGRVDLQEVPSWLQASDLFALLSPNEGLSCALLEGMASGLASVVSDIPANRQLIDDRVHGLTVPFDDEGAAEEALLKLLCSADLRKHMGEAARSRAVGNYSTDRVVDRYEAMLSEVMVSK